MKIIITSITMFFVSVSGLLAENWLPNIGYYDNPNEISAKDNIKSDQVFDFENSANPGGEELEDGKYYVPVRYQGGNNGIDEDYIYAEDLKGADGKDGIDADMTKVNANTAVNLDQQASLNEHERRLHDLTETKYILEGDIRLIDRKRYSLHVFGNYDVRHDHGHEVGFRAKIKLGTSYEERLLKKLEERVQQLENRRYLTCPPQVIYVPVEQKK